jgi:hypothetical protein
MSVGPVQSVGFVKEEQTGSGIRPDGQSQTTAPQTGEMEKAAQPATGYLPKAEQAGTKSIPSPAELPQDEVQVQRDSQIRDEVVIKYLDTVSGNLILQVPSAEVLSVDHGIYQEFQQQAKVRDDTSVAAAEGKGEKSYGH